MSKSSCAKTKRKNIYEVVKRWYFRNAIRVGLHFVLQRFYGACVCLKYFINILRSRNTNEKKRHPQFRYQHVHRYHGAKNIFANLEYFLHRRLVCATTNPRTSNSGHSSPYFFRISSNDVWRHSTEKQNTKRATYNHTYGSCKEHDQCLWPQLNNLLKVYAQC